MFKRFSRFNPCIVITVISGLYLFPSQAYAYLDPGTGSMILQGIIGGLATLAVVVKLYWHSLLRFLGLRKGNLPNTHSPNLYDKSHDKISNSKKIGS